MQPVQQNIRLFRLFYSLLFFAFYLPQVYAAPDYAGAEQCQQCHQEEYQLWQGSHHDLAMQVANDKSVLGDFNAAEFEHAGINTRFYKDKQRFMVNTEGADGKMHDFEISYTFGVYPLQQYMVKFEHGKIQVLDIAWDSRSKEQGGQRWFALHPDEKISADDVLHWTGPNLNWNYMCADCHSTGLQKNYQAENNSYQTKWAHINVSCEACHGPASEHINWAKTGQQGANKGLSAALASRSIGQWHIDKQSARPKADKQTGDVEIEICARCHSRRSQIDDKFLPGDNFRDHYLPSMLNEPLYYPDGKINDEVFVYASFLQSRMYKAGVSCSNCHDPHSLKLKAPGDKVCAQCHASENYASTQHHHHEQNSEGASCINCHMPAKTYMGVDERNDHSFRIPRPDLSSALETPNACNHCHQVKTSAWAAKTIQQWFKHPAQGYQQFGPALKAVQNQDADALKQTYQVLINENPDIAKATLVAYLGNYPSRQTLTTSIQMLKSANADKRRQALLALESFPLEHSLTYLFDSLNDEEKIVRLEAARILAPVARGELDKTQRQLIDQVTEEYRQSLLFAADRPEAQVSLARLYEQQGQNKQAEAAYQQALSLQSQYIPAYINYANFLQQQGNEQGAYKILKTGLTISNEAALHHALGLWYVRNKQRPQALLSLQQAAKLQADNARFQYVYAVALAEKDPAQAIQVLQSALQQHSGNIEILMALSSYYQQQGDAAKANLYRNKAEQVMRANLNMNQ